MKKIKDNQIIDLRNKTEEEKNIELGKLSEQINNIFEKNKIKKEEDQAER